MNTRTDIGSSARLVSGLLWGLLIVLLVLGVTARWSLRRTQPLDFDEFQHLHIGWCWTQGLVPYRDFWDNHPPLLHLLLAGLQPIHGEMAETIFVARGAMFVLGLAVLAATFGLTRAVYDSGSGLAAATLLACVQVFTDKTAEVRPDSGLILFALVTVWLLVRAMRADHRRAVRVNCAAAGLTFGLATLFSTKSMMLAGALAVGFLVLASRRWRSLVWFTFGLAFAIAPACVYFAARGGLAELVRLTVLDNLSYPERFSAWRWLEATWSTPMAIVLALGLISMLTQRFRNGDKRDAPWLVFAVAFALLLQFAVLMPAPYAQSACLPLAFLVIPAGRLLRTLIGWVTRPGGSASNAWAGGVAALLLMLAGPADSLLRFRLSHQGDAGELHRQLAMTGRLLELTGPNDAVFGDAPWAVFRPHACFHPTLTQGVLQEHSAGRVRNPIEDDLRRYGCTLVVESHPPRPLPAAAQEFIRGHFVSLEPFLLVPGRRFSADDLADGSTTFEAIASGVYHVSPPGSMVIDGKEAADGVFLDAGMHKVTARDTQNPLAARILRYPGQ